MKNNVWSLSTGLLFLAGLMLGGCQTYIPFSGRPDVILSSTEGYIVKNEPIITKGWKFDIVECTPDRFTGNVSPLGEYELKWINDKHSLSKFAKQDKTQVVVFYLNPTYADSIPEAGLITITSSNIDIMRQAVYQPRTSEDFTRVGTFVSMIIPSFISIIAILREAGLKI